MKKSFNIFLIAFLLVLGSSCSKFTPLERVNDKENSFMLKSGEEAQGELDSTEGITDPEHDEDHDADFNITDTDNEEDHDKENAKG